MIILRYVKGPLELLYALCLLWISLVSSSPPHVFRQQSPPRVLYTVNIIARSLQLSVNTVQQGI